MIRVNLYFDCSYKTKKVDISSWNFFNTYIIVMHNFSFAKREKSKNEEMKKPKKTDAFICFSDKF